MKTPRELNLPEKFREWRPEQTAIIEKFVGMSGSLLVEAPTGVGKTIVGAAIQKLLEAPATYITPNIFLQEQICEDFPYAKMVKGREHYYCPRYGLNATVCDHSKSEPCEYEEECPYRAAREEARRAELAVLNSSYYLYASYYTEAFRRPLLIVDEVDLFEQSLLTFVKIELPKSSLRKLEVTPRADFTSEQWVVWAREVLPHINRLVDECKDVGEAEYWRRLKGKVEYMVKNVDETWFTEVDEKGKITFRPVVVDKYASTLVWRNHSRVLGMSGTILNPRVVGREIGLEADYFSVSCPFPVENRPIYNLAKYVGGLNHQNITESLPRIALLLQRVIDAYPDGKILVHCQSYALARGLFGALGCPRVVLHDDRKNRESILSRFLNSDNPLVLLSPSFKRGLDLSGESYQCIVVVKAPFADLSSEAVVRRRNMEGGREWYERDAAANLMQALGRGVRSMDDKCDMFILDASCLRLVQKCPEWFRRAVQEYG